MQRLTMLACGLAIGAMASVAVYSQTGPAASPAVIYEGARLILGSASASPINDGAFVVQNGMITAIGRKGAVAVPAGAARVDLTGKTVIPALIDVHAHFGYNTVAGQGVSSANYTPENLYDQFQREAFYGVGTVHDGGTAVVPLSLQFQADQKAGKYPGASRYVFAPGITPPDGGPDEWLIEGTRPLHANFEVIKAPEARAVVKELAAKNIRNVKLWVGDRNGTYPAMPHEVYDAIIDEAHKHNIKVHSHAMIVRDQKDILRAGADVIVHIVTTARIDNEEI
jgi:imidazolonepropionase-like amidohydrolase